MEIGCRVVSGDSLRVMKTQELANKLCVDRSRVSRYLSGSDRVPCHIVASYCRLTKKPLKEVRPDLYRSGLRVLGDCA